MTSFIDHINKVPHIEEKIFDSIKVSSAPVMLFGAGEIAHYLLVYFRQHGIEPACLCDNNPARQGTMHLGLPVYSYNSFKEKFGASGGKYNIVISTGPQYKDAIHSQLMTAQEKNPIWYLRGYEVCGEKINYQYVCEHKAQFEEAYSSLADDFSKKVFQNVLNAKISGDFNFYKEVLSKNQHFDKDIVKLSDKEVFLDVGAFKGSDIVEFVKCTGGNYEGIIAFEPDKKTSTILQSLIVKDGIQKIEVHNKGAWKEHAFLHFDEGREGSSRITKDAVAVATPAVSIEVDTIDNVLNGRRITYISMDIEGAEHDAFLGGKNSIKKWRPKIAVSAYHKREDLFDLLLLLKSFVPDYKFYLRHYTENQTETVLHAI